MSKHDELEKLLAAATPGEWSVCQCVQLEGDTLFQIEVRVKPDVLQCVSIDIAGMEDAAAIVALHNAAPGLIADNRRLAERVRVLERALDECDRARIMIGAKLDSVSEVQKEAAINEAWHVLQRAITKADARKALEASHDQ